MNGSGNPFTPFPSPILVADYVERAVGAVLILVVGWLVLRYLVGPLRRLLDRSRLDAAAASFLANSTRSAIIVIVLVTVLQKLGVPTASLVTLLGAAGLAVALSLQGALANFASGLLLLSFRMVRVGDLIEVGDLRGQVNEMLPFHIVLITGDNQRITVPNTLLTSGPIRNNSALPVRRVQWTLPVTPRDDLAAIKEALRRRLQADPRILTEPAPQLYVQDWGGDRLLLTVAAWAQTANYLAVQQELLEELGKSLEGVRHQAATTGS